MSADQVLPSCRLSDSGAASDLSLRNFNSFRLKRTGSSIRPCIGQDSVTGTTSQSDTIDVSVAEAANLLGITERSVWRRIRQGKLSSKLIGGKAVLTLRQSDIATSQADRLTDTKDSQSDQPTDVSVISASSLEGSRTIELVAEFASKLEAATYRNGYLEAQLDAHKEQIKLLPDYQHRAMEAEGLRARV